MTKTYADKYFEDKLNAPKEKPHTVYISGPMTGIEDYNYPLFHRVHNELENLGFKVVNPANTGVREGWEWRDYLTVDVMALLIEGVETIVLLDGWENSKGAKLEVHIGEALGMNILPYADFILQQTQ